MLELKPSVTISRIRKASRRSLPKGARKGDEDNWAVGIICFRLGFGIIIPIFLDSLQLVDGSRGSPMRSFPIPRLRLTRTRLGDCRTITTVNKLMLYERTRESYKVKVLPGPLVGQTLLDCALWCGIEE